MMPNEINHSRTRNSSFYDQKYGSGNGWKYNTDKVTRWLQESIVSRFGLTPGDRVLELGCGEGHHSALLASFGLDVYGVDFSEKGIEVAKERGSGATFIAANALDLGRFFDHGYFDLIFVRGMSWYHYELSGISRIGIDIDEETGKLFEFLKPGGTFVLQIKTDFSGNKPTENVFDCRLSEFKGLFSQFGEIIHTSNTAGAELIDDEQAAKIKGGIVMAIRKHGQVLL
ncbi:class I SAM-dependent methyltransferase [Gimesia chilikensis]|uniref:class I SAM-dependent methyltransferase n=1 Tax=Gimesia chilikensis TaxID=2605989 RepID=UPI000C4EE375|nr:class I SAM-dependent methyltransferase [Gimesia chilikensis]MBN70265.1 hypothetical protein [Gimesia sp.]MCR9231567.1 class I SAM-dependent methyltransferase [bacterium]